VGKCLDAVHRRRLADEQPIGIKTHAGLSRADLASTAARLSRLIEYYRDCFYLAACLASQIALATASSQARKFSAAL